MAREFPLATRLTARDSASPVLTGLGNHAKKIGRSIQGLGRSWSIGVTAPITALGAATATTVFSFRKEMNKVRALTGATGESFDQLRNQAKDLGRTTKFSASEAAGAQAFLAQAGFKTNQIFGAMPATLNLAAAAGTELAETGDIASNVMTQFGIRAEDLGRAGDVMTRAFSTSNTDLLQLGAAMKFVGPVASRVGIEFETVNAVIGAFSDAGIQGEMAGTSLRGAINSLLKPSGAAIATFKRLGIAQDEILTEDGKVRDFVGLMERLSDLGADQTDVLSIFGQRPGTAVGALLGQLEQFGRDRLRSKELDLFQNSEGSAAAQAKAREQGIVGAFNRVKSAFEGAKIAIGDSGLEGSLEGLANKLSGALNWISQLPAPTLKVASAMAGFAAAVGPALLGLGGLIRVVGFSLSGLGFLKTGLALAGSAAKFLAGRLVLALGPALVNIGAGLTLLGGKGKLLALTLASRVTPAFAGLGVVMRANPIGAVITLVGLLGAAGVALYKNWDTVTAKLGSAWESIRSMFGSGVEWITSKLNSIPGFDRLLDFVGIGGPSAAVVDNSRVAAAVGPGRGQDGRARVEIDVRSGRENVRATATAVEDVDLQLEQGMLLGVSG